MIKSLLSLLWSLLMLPIKLIMLPFKIVSAIITIVFYGVILLLLSGALYLFVL